MYGLLLEGIRQFIISTYGNDKWEYILLNSSININVFEVHKLYDESTIQKIVKTTSEHCHISEDEIMYQNGQFFIGYLTQFGYDSILRVLGRDLRDFLNGLDNLHEYLRFTYPNLKPPSFFCVNESRNGITLQYRTRRQGFMHYVRGQIYEISRRFYDTNVRVEIISEGLLKDSTVINCIYRLHFNNCTYQSDEIDELVVPSEIFFEVFPFNIIFNRGMKIVCCGRGMKNLVPNIIGENVSDRFIINRPIIESSWDSIILHSNNVFELVLLQYKKCSLLEEYAEKSPLINIPNQTASTSNYSEFNESNSSICQSTNSNPDLNCRLRMRGQMKYMKEWDSVAFLGTPIMRDVTSMWKAGLYINDLSMHDSSRDLVLAGEQQSAELRLALEQESEKSKRLEDSLKRLDEEMKRTDELLYQMIPRAVANRLRSGAKSVSTCETFLEVTVLFSDVVGFTNICSQLTPFQVVEMLNAMYSEFDCLTELHRVYKVETIGDAYMIASGCPIPTKMNAPLIAETALDMLVSIERVRDPSYYMCKQDPNEDEDHSTASEVTKNHLKIRVGIHTGTVVAGVVGIKMPRYCLFGDTVNTASRMESTSETQKIQMSSSTRDKLTKYRVYDISRRGLIELKGKGQVTTYWLNGHLTMSNDNNLNHFLKNLDIERENLGDDNLSTSQSNSKQDWRNSFSQSFYRSDSVIINNYNHLNSDNDNDDGFIVNGDDNDDASEASKISKLRAVGNCDNIEEINSKISKFNI